MDLTEFKSWARGIAHSMCADHARAEDVAQEALIEIWKADKIYDPTRGSRIPFLKQRARWRMLMLLSGRANYEGNKNYTKHKTSPAGTPVDPAVFDVEEEKDTPEIKYHTQEIAAAVKDLSPRQQEYVLYRFWLGWSESDMKSLFGYHPSALWRSRRNGARYKLQKSLAHLENV